MYFSSSECRAATENNGKPRHEEPSFIIQNVLGKSTGGMIPLGPTRSMEQAVKTSMYLAAGDIWND